MTKVKAREVKKCSPQPGVVFGHMGEMDTNQSSHKDLGKLYPNHQRNAAYFTFHYNLQKVRQCL